MTITFYVFNLAITCYQTSYVTALFVNMVFSSEDKILIKNISVEGMKCETVEEEFPDKGWTKSSINRLLKKFTDTGTVDRRQGSGRPRSACTDENIDQVNDMVLSQEEQPRTHSTVREISRGTGIPKSSVRIVKNYLQLKCFKRRCMCARAD